ncbi:MAG: RidA family protein [Thermoleophilaceae bacterium]|nr:RidA family protein [Thermoleophilaceae bacterium]
MTKQLISSGSDFEAVAGYSRAVVDEHYIHVSGTTGFDYDLMEIDADPEIQAHQCFSNISAALAQAGATLDDVVRVRYYLAKPKLFEQLAPIFGKYLGEARPAATAIGVKMVDPKIAIEIEVTATRR